PRRGARKCCAKCSSRSGKSESEIGAPCPEPRTFGRSFANSLSELRAELQLIVNGAGGPASCGRAPINPTHESMFTLTKASPVRRTRSEARNKQMCPGECPGVGTHSQPGAPGTL